MSDLARNEAASLVGLSRAKGTLWIVGPARDAIEQMVRESPEQYLWVHKRFKSRPDGQPSVY